MTDVSGNLPPDMKPHESDPKPQQFLAGRLVATVVIAGTYDVRVTDECKTVDRAAVVMQQRLEKLIDLVERLGYAEINVYPTQFDPD